MYSRKALLNLKPIYNNVVDQERINFHYFANKFCLKLKEMKLKDFNTEYVLSNIHETNIYYKNKTLQGIKTYLLSDSIPFKFEFNDQIFDFNISLVSIGGYKFWTNTSSIIIIKEFNTFDDKDNTFLTSLLSHVEENNETTNNQLIDSKTFGKEKEEFDKVNEKIQLLSNYENEIKNNETEELQALEIKMKQIEEEMNKIKEAKLSELQLQKNKMMKLQSKMQRKIWFLQVQISALQGYFNETFDIVQLRKGMPSNKEQPINLYQKFRYLDVEIAKYFSIKNYDADKGGKELFQDIISNRMDFVEMLIPSEKGICVLKSSETGRGYERNSCNGDDNSQVNILSSYVKDFGNQLALLIRNGQNVYAAWIDDEMVQLTDDMYYLDHSETTYTDEDYKKIISVNKIKANRIDEQEKIADYMARKESGSRFILFSTIQGILDQTNILDVPSNEKFFNGIDVNKKHPYIVYNNADLVLNDSNGLNFSELMNKYSTGKNLNKVIQLIKNEFVNEKELSDDELVKLNKSLFDFFEENNNKLNFKFKKNIFIDLKENMINFLIQTNNIALHHWFLLSKDTQTKINKEFKSVTKKGDDVYVFEYLMQDDNRSFGYKDTIGNSTLEKGINKINLIDISGLRQARLLTFYSGNDIELIESPNKNDMIYVPYLNRKEHYYISVKKDGSYYDGYDIVDYKNNANFEINSNEFINLTFLTSQMIEYCIINKAISNHDYAHFVPDLQEIYKFLKEREQNELNQLISLDDNFSDEKFRNIYVPNLIELISKWKYENNVHNFTDFQAKRFLNTLKD